MGAGGEKVKRGRGVHGEGVRMNRDVKSVDAAYDDTVQRTRHYATYATHIHLSIVTPRMCGIDMGLILRCTTIGDTLPLRLMKQRRVRKING